MSQFYTFPPGFATATNPSVGTAGSAAPTSATEVAGVDSGSILRPLSVDSSGKLNINISSVSPSPLPVQDSAAEASLASIDSKLNSLGQKAMAASMPVVITSDQSSIPVADSAAEASLSSISSNISARLSGSLVPAAFDEVDLTYVPSGPGAGQVATAIYKLASSTVKTLTMSYDGSNRLSSVVAS